jgi:hypothetical protein
MRNISIVVLAAVLAVSLWWSHRLQSQVDLLTQALAEEHQTITGEVATANHIANMAFDTADRTANQVYDHAWMVTATQYGAFPRGQRFFMSFEPRSSSGIR